jgi:hypothetical protein
LRFSLQLFISTLAGLLRTRLDEGAKCWLDGEWPRNRGTAEPTVWAKQVALYLLHLALERCLVTRGEEVRSCTNMLRRCNGVLRV